MRSSKTKYGSARIACLGLFLVCASDFVLAQEPDEAKGAATGNTIVAVAPEQNEGITYNVPLVPADLQKSGATATPATVSITS